MSPTTAKVARSVPAGGRVAKPVSSTIPVVPMKPQRGALVVLSVLLAAWVLTLITLYFTTVRPLTHRSVESAPGASATPAAPTAQQP